MTGTRPVHTGATAMLLAAAMLLGLPSGLGGAGVPQLPENDPYITNAAVIKTQTAADTLLRQGGVRGIDVSKHNGAIDWAKVAKNNVSFAFIRASYGTTKDPNFLTNARNAHANGIKVGAYHYATFRNREEMLAEAAYFIKRIKKVDITYPVVLDLESEMHKSIKRSTLTGLALEFMDIVRAEGYQVMLYTYNNFLRDHLSQKKLNGYDLWIANYLEQPSEFDHRVWQHTSHGTVKGISGTVDINIAYQDLSTSGTPASAQTTSNTPLDGAVGEPQLVRVSKSVSNSIKNTLNDRYDVGIPMDGLDMDIMNRAIDTGLQQEINRQWEVNEPVTGSLNQNNMNYLTSLTFTSSTKGNITYLIQARLFYKGYYSGNPTGRFDEDTVNAVQRFQQENGLFADGDLDAETMYALLMN